MNNTRLIVNFILALFVLIILCNSRRVEKYMESDEPLVEEETMEVAEEPLVEEETMEVVEEPLVESEPMVEADIPEIAVEETDVSMAAEPDIGMMDATSVDMSLPAIETPVPDGVELGYYDFSKVMYF